LQTGDQLHQTIPPKFDVEEHKLLSCPVFEQNTLLMNAYLLIPKDYLHPYVVLSMNPSIKYHQFQKPFPFLPQGLSPIRKSNYIHNALHTLLESDCLL
jgi:hypothetical protein